jgi:penicillin-binding protein 1A
LLAILGLLGFASFTYGLMTAIAGEIPPLDPANRSNQTNGYIYASDGHTVLAVLRGDESRVLVESNEIAPVMKSAIVAIEDRRFYEHRGVDLRGIVRAVWADVRHKRVVEGGSTITQQFVKNAYVKNQRTIARKLREAALAWQLEQRWKKDRILTAYLNTIYFGNQAYGVQQAARVYFDKQAKRLTLPEAALLAGIPSDPTAYDPAAHPQAARARRNVVLHAMLTQGVIGRGEYRRAVATALPKPQDIHLPGTEGQAPYFANYVKEQLLAHYKSPRKVFGRGLRVTTTIDLGLQRIARESVAKWLPPDPENPNHPTAAVVALDPKTGAVLAMVGGENYHRSQFNLATQRNRQTGSAFKPFVLATALRDGISPETTLVSAPITINLGDRLWPVANYENEYMGRISLATATTHSDNSVYAQLTALVGPKRVAATARRAGVTGKLSGFYSIGLGGEPASPLDMARAYGAFADGGYRIDGALMGNTPRAIETIRVKGKTLVNAPVKEPVLDRNLTAIVNQLLQDVVRSGTGRRAALPGWSVAGKTGTTSNYGDAWFVGYTPQLVTAVWVGYPTRLVPMLTDFHGDSVAGGTFPALIWKSFMERASRYWLKQAAHEDPARATERSFAAPLYPYSSAVRVTVRDGKLERDNGYCRSTTMLVFFSGKTPSAADCKLNEVAVPRVVGQTVAAARAHLEAQPLTPTYVYKPAAPRQQLGIVLGQFPARGTLSSYDKVTLVLAKPLHGTVPKVTGVSAERAQAKLTKRKLVGVVHGVGSRVVSQQPKAGVAAAPGMRVTLVLGRG